MNRMTRLRVLEIEESFALRSTSYRKFLYGSFLTRSTDWMELTILNWLVYEWTNSTLALALLNACRLLPVFAFSLLAGGLADRFNRQKLLMINYFGLFISTIIIAFFIQRQFSMPWLLAAVTFKSILMTVEIPVRNAYLSDLVPKTMLPSAISIQTTIINLARMIGPALSGMLLIYFSPGTLMYFISLGTLFVIVSLFLIESIEQKEVRQPRVQIKHSLKDLWQYITQQPKVLSILLVAVAPMIFGFPYTTMLPFFSKELFGLGPDGFGLLLSISSFGAIIATLLLSIGQPRNSGRLLVTSALCFGMCLCFFVLFYQSYILTFLIMFLIGFSSQYYRTLSRVVLQVNVEGAYRGRVLAIALMDRGYIPLGALLIGWVGNTFGALSAGLFMGISCFLSTLCIALLRKNLWNSSERRSHNGTNRTENY
jgi:MFS family permease